MKHVNKTNVKATMRECYRACERKLDFKYTFYDLNEDWQVGFYIGLGDEGCRAQLWNWREEVEFETPRMLMYDSMTDLLNAATAYLMEQYESYARQHPWVELEGAERNAFENACDYMRYGEGGRAWVERGHDCGIRPSRRALIWKMAWCCMGDGIMHECDWVEVA